jgi:hypothetical protein
MCSRRDGHLFGGGLNAKGHILSRDDNGVKVPALNLHDVARLVGKPIDFMNIDIEGLDEAIILDDAFDALKPTVLAIEQFAENVHDLLSRPSTLKLISMGYILVARVGPTSIFKQVPPLRT